MADMFDYIVIGAGSAGCVLAGRLSDEPGRRVLLLEAGGNGKGLLVTIPAGFFKLMRSPRHNWMFAAEPDPDLGARSMPMPRGKGLGGSSNINAMIYVRGNPADFDQWAQSGNRGWSYVELLPYFIKSENYAGGDPDIRGNEGPLHVTEQRERSELPEAFLAAAAAEGHRTGHDYNAGSQDGFAYYQLKQWRGRRWSAARAYLDLARTRPNLRIETEARATRILIDQGRAVGVVYHRGGEDREVRCVGEVLLSAGAVQSPQLLELSGIGDPALLGLRGVVVRHALPGVGENYHDHFAARLSWRVKRRVSLNERTRGLALAREAALYFLLHRGALTSSAGSVGGWARSRPDLIAPDLQYTFIQASFPPTPSRELEREPGMTLAVNPCKPASRGSIHIRSNDPFSPPAIRPNAFSDPLDRDTTLTGIRLGRRIVENAAMDQYRAFETEPGPAAQSDEDLLAFIRATGQTTHHIAGTCKMGTDSLAVVDERLRVRGVDGLRVVDASIMPTSLCGSIGSAVIAIAEKAADMIRADARQFPV